MAGIPQHAGRHLLAEEEISKTRSRMSNAVSVCTSGTDYLWGVANALSNLAILYFRMGRWQEAAKAVKKSAVIRRKIGDIQGEAISLANLGLS